MFLLHIISYIEIIRSKQIKGYYFILINKVLYPFPISICFLLFLHKTVTRACTYAYFCTITARDVYPEIYMFPCVLFLVDWIPRIEFLFGCFSQLRCQMLRLWLRLKQTNACTGLFMFCLVWLQQREKLTQARNKHTHIRGHTHNQELS